MDREYEISKDAKVKKFRSENYNWNYNLENGYFARWGKTKDEDPNFSPYGPEIADIEITTKCGGISGRLCNYCYKSNTPKGLNMNFETFKKVIEKINPCGNLGQVAFGLGSTAEENPELWQMCKWLRVREIIPNGTVAQITNETADKIAKYFGACAVSVHDHVKDWREVFCDSVYKLTSRGMKQVNCHFVLAQETLPALRDLLDLRRDDERLKDLNAIVLLSIKECGRAANGKYHRVTDEQFEELCKYLLLLKHSFGFDSCTAPRFTKFINKNKEYDHLKSLIEPCESGLFSIYVNAEGIVYPCSFNEKEDEEYRILERNDFEIWWNASTWREKLLSNNRNCPSYSI